MRRMFEEQEKRVYYLTVMNENYVQPLMPEGRLKASFKGIYLLDSVGKKKNKL